ncbi:MAG: FIST C-terminal domain-containing protein [Candidatus Omnitrophica bacterium]|nr:FIST C-terminal domain-containing protein [Candidatus Omnitrophota bacterium]
MNTIMQKSVLEIGTGASKNRDCLQAVHEAISQAKTNLGKETAGLAIVFATIEFARPVVAKIIANLLGPTPVIGASSAAVISNQGIWKNGIVIMLVNFPEEIFVNHAFVKDMDQKGGVAGGLELAEKLLSGFAGKQRDLSVIFSDGIIKEKKGLITGLQEKLGRSFPVVGASASDNFHFSKTFVYANQEVFNNGACGLLFGGRVNFGLGIKHGWKTLGKPRYITKAVDNTVYEIDGKPAADTYQQYLGFDLPRLKTELKRISIFYPLGITLAGEKECLLRNIIAIGDDGSCVCQGDVPVNSQVRLMIGTKESALSATKQALDQAKEQLKNCQTHFALLFNSASRLMLLGRDANRELEIVKESLGENTPVIGLYTFGEQAPLTAAGYHGISYFHSQTFTILGIGTKN